MAPPEESAGLVRGSVQPNTQWGHRCWRSCLSKSRHYIM